MIGTVAMILRELPASASRWWSRVRDPAPRPGSPASRPIRGSSSGGG